MPLSSNLFKNNHRLQSCAVSDSAHVTPGSAGDFVHLIQLALEDLDGLTIDPAELAASRYGPSTAAAVLAFKKKRKIVNHAYQSTEDDIVGKMTIAAMDKELSDQQVTPKPGNHQCAHRDGPTVARVRDPAPVGKTFDIA
jgi:peptidoglycan hydrolase-like protein with peptidoglycan-binding domain